MTPGESTPTARRRAFCSAKRRRNDERSSDRRRLAPGCGESPSRSMAGMAEQIIAGGTESMSLVRGNGRYRPNPELMEHRPEAYLSMGLTAENVARKYSISRQDADAFSYRSHQKALAAQKEGRFADDGMVPLEVEMIDAESRARKTFDTDEGPRADTTLEALAKLRPVFHAKGRVTGGHSRQ